MKMAPTASLLRGFAAACVIVCVAHVAQAARPSDAEVMQVQALLGVDVAFATIVERTSRKLSEELVADLLNGKTLDETQRADMQQMLETCLKGEMLSALGALHVNSFREWLESSENAKAWVEFSRGSGGAAFLQYNRDRMSASLGGISSPLQGMSPEDKVAIATFLRSPAAQVLEKPFPKFLDEANQNQLTQQVMAQCIVGDAAAMEALLNTVKNRPKNNATK